MAIWKKYVLNCLALEGCKGLETQAFIREKGILGREHWNGL